MSAAGPPALDNEGTRPLGGAARSAVRGTTSAAGAPKALAPGGTLPAPRARIFGAVPWAPRARSPPSDAFPTFLKPTAMNDTVLFTRDGPVATLTLNRPNDLNVLNDAMVDALVAHTTAIAGDDSLRVVVLRGAGRHFMAGGDIRSFAARLGEAPAVRSEGFARMIGRLHAAIEHLHRMPHPVVGRVHGAVAGFGLSLMNACDLVVAADDAYFASAYRQIAVTPDGGGTWSLPRLVGVRKAMEIFLLGERFGAAEALSLGIVNRVVPAAELDAAINAIVNTIATGPVLALRNAKRLVRESLARTLSEQLDAEAASFAGLRGHGRFRGRHQRVPCQATAAVRA